MSLEGRGVGRVILPKYFYSLTALTDEARPRWVDEFADEAPSIIQPKDLNSSYLKARAERNMAYSKWLASFFYKDNAGQYHSIIKPGMMKWQAIRVLHDTHSETSRQDWWPRYRDCLFRVFLNPQTVYDDITGEHKQWYLLCPEDSYLVNRQEIVDKGGNPPSRNYKGNERYFSADRNLRRARLIPTECCHHLINEGQEYKQDL